MKTKTFESALEEIEKILRELEGGNLPLKESVTKFNEGYELLKFCNKELKEAEMSIQKIADKNGKLSFEEF